MPEPLQTLYGNYESFAQKPLVRPAKCIIGGGSNAQNPPPSCPLTRLCCSLSGHHLGRKPGQLTTALQVCLQRRFRQSDFRQRCRQVSAQQNRATCCQG